MAARVIGASVDDGCQRELLQPPALHPERAAAAALAPVMMARRWSVRPCCQSDWRRQSELLPQADAAGGHAARVLGGSCRAAAAVGGCGWLGWSQAGASHDIRAEAQLIGAVVRGGAAHAPGGPPDQGAGAGARPETRIGLVVQV